MASGDTTRDNGRTGRPSSATLWMVRTVFMVLWLAVTFIAIFRFGGETGRADSAAFRAASEWWWPLSISLTLFAAVVAIDIATPTKKLQTVSGVFMGLLAGILAAVAVGFVIDLITQLANVQSPAVVGAAQILIGVAGCYLGVSIVLQTQDEFRLVIPYVEFAKQIRGARPLLLDTSAIIDGRFLNLAETGVTQAPIIIPTFVLAELQALADSADRGKRQRGRRGLDVVSKLQRSPRLDVSIDETIVPGKSVDQMLVELGQMMTATIVTTDAALDRIAGIKGVNVLNMNDVASAVKSEVAPGEELDLRVIRAGEQPGQGVGYLEDGTMVVIVDGGHRIGEVVSATVTNSLQTSAGRLIFAQIERDGDADGEGANGESAEQAEASRLLNEDARRRGRDASMSPQSGEVRAGTGAPAPPPGRNPRR